MDVNGPEREKASPSLAAALRTARAEAAERSQSMTDLRGAAMARLDLLRAAIEPVLAQVPEEVDLFDTGIVPGEHPRLFVDMIAFVEMGRDTRTYRFHLDTRHGRVLLAETESLAAMTDAVTDYIARRLVERERALASLSAEGLAPRPLASDEPRPHPSVLPAPVHEAHKPSGSTGRLIHAVRYGLDGAGLLALGGLVWFGLRYAQGLPVW